MAGGGSWLLNLMSETILGSLSDLTTGPVRAAARQIINAAIPLGRTPTQIMTDLRDADIYYGRDKMLDDVRSLYTLADNRDYMKSIPDDRIVAKSRMAEARLPRDANYLVTFRVNVTNPVTGQVTEEYRSMYTNARGSKDDYWNEFVEGMSETVYGVAFEYDYLDTESVTHNRGFPYED